MTNDLSELYESILDGNQNKTRAGVEQALAKGLSPVEILNAGMISAMQEVGKRFEDGEYFVPEMLIAARAMQAGLAILKPHLREMSVQPAGKVAIGTVKGDLHDIGKNLVGMMLEGGGFEIQDLGTDVAPEKVVAVVQAGAVDIVALSALLTTTMPNMKRTIEALQQAGLREQVKVIIGGAPVTETYARQIGADGYSPDASRTVALAKKLME